MYTVYKHTAPNGKVYIGITKQKPEQRWNYGNGYRRNKHFYSAIAKYGWDNIEHEIVENGLTKQQACDLEIELIAKYDATNPRNGYNNSTGGECGSLGVHPIAETRRKMSEANKGQKQTPQQRDALMNYLIGHEVSAETRRKISEAGKGRTPWNKGKKASEEAKAKNSIAAIKLGKIPPYIKPTKVVCVETGEVFHQIKDAGEKYGICPANITAVCRHRRERAGGYHWEYAD